MLNLQLMAKDPGFIRPVPRFAEEGLNRNGAQLIVDGDDAAIERDFLLRVFKFINDMRAIGGAEGDRREKTETLGLDRVPETLRILIKADEADTNLFRERQIDIYVAAVLFEPASRETQCPGGLKSGPFGDHVDGSARFAAPEKRRLRAF